MERHIKLTDVENVVRQVYDKYKDLETDGEVDPRLKNVDPARFGIVVTLTDGRTIKVGDTDIASPLGAIARIPAFAVLREQKLDKDNKQHCCKRSIKEDHGEKPRNLPVSAHALRLISKIQPRGDKDGKFGVIEDMVEAMAGDAPVLDDALYEQRMKTNEAANVENLLAQAGFELYDDAPAVIDTYTKLASLTLTVEQTGMMGATLAADGRNPKTGEFAFDGEIAPKIVAYMAAKGPHRLSLPWLVKSGLPAKNSFGGLLMGVYPGVMSIAAYSPVVNDDGVSIKAFKAIHHIMKHLDINVFDSATLVID